MTARRLVLGSTSPYRRELLQRLHLPFDTRAPDCDESPLPGESAPELVRRLSIAKAAAVARDLDDALVIGSDQVAALGERILTKPGSHECAREQLQACSARSVVFHTGLAVIDAASGAQRSECIDYAVDFRPLTNAQIERYLEAERPYDCAGSIRSEGHAVVLFERLRGDDPSALIGLPLIRLCALLREFGLEIP